MADLATDNFNRANGGLGANWTTVSGLSDPQIRSNLVETFSVGPSSMAVYTGVAWPNDQYAYLTLVANTSTSAYGVVLLRYATGANTGYQIYLNGVLGGSPTITVGRSNAGVGTTLSGPTTVTFAAGSVLKGQIIGTALKVFIDNVEVSALAVTDGSPIASGNAGLYVLVSSGATANAQLDNWGGGATAVSTPIAAVGRRMVSVIYAQG